MSRKSGKGCRCHLSSVAFTDVVTVIPVWLDHKEFSVECGQIGVSASECPLKKVVPTVTSVWRSEFPVECLQIGCLPSSVH